MRSPYLYIFLFILALSVGHTGAQQKPAPQSAPKEDEPVAITPKVVREKTVETKPIASDQFGNFRFPIINNKGEIAFMALYNAPGAPNNAGQAIFVRATDGSWRTMREGEKAPNGAEVIRSFGTPAFNDNGDLTFFASFVPPADHAANADPNNPEPQRYGALFIKNASGLKSLVKLSEEVPLMPSQFSGISNPSTNTKGVTAFIGTYIDPDGRGLFMVEEGKLRLVARSGQRIGNGEEGTFSEHYYPSQINERSEIAFMARVGDRSAIFAARPKGVELLAMTGKPAPIKGSNFIGFGNRAPAINNKGEVAFVAFFDGPENGRGLFVKGDGPTQLIARSGDRAGDVGGTFTDFLSPAINARGEVAFIGKLGGRMQGIFLKTAKGIEPVVMVDQKIPGAKTELDVFNNFMQPSLNDRGEVVFYGQIKNAEVAIFHRDEKGALKMLVKRGDKMPK
jgi:hypothetical protein